MTATPQTQEAEAPAPAQRATEVLSAREAAAAVLAEILEQARDYACASKATNTQRAYHADWVDFTTWCRTHGLTALPAAPETVVLYLTALAPRRKTSTLTRRLSAIAQAHKAADLTSPTAHQAVRTVMAGIRRTKGTAQTGKEPIVTDEVRCMVEALPPTLLGRRDAALLLLGYAGAFRRSELVALDVGDVLIKHEGLEVTLRKSKTDQEGEGRKVGIPTGINLAFQGWDRAVIDRYLV